MTNPLLRVPLPVAGLLALAVAMGIGRFAFTPILPLMQADAGLTLAQGGWLASANYLGYLVGALTITRITWSAETLLRAGLWLVVITTTAMGVDISHETISAITDAVLEEVMIWQNRQLDEFLLLLNPTPL